MKEEYKKPAIISMKEGNGVVPFAVAAALVGGYAAARAVTNAMKASPISKLQGIGDGTHDLSMA